VVLQGVDTTIFHPAPKSGLLAHRFIVFSGGKLEYRKGQDLVAQAFAIFAQRHPDALLLTAWHSPFPNSALSFNQVAGSEVVQFLPTGFCDLRAWTQRHGIPDNQVFHLGLIPNLHLPRILREADVALFANRAEGGTNLVAMECMACGIPTILSANTGHLDLIQPDTCYALQRQSPIPDPKHRGWGESDVDEMVETLETVYQDRTGAARRGQRGAEWLSTLTWAKQMNRFAEVIAPFVP
jgi:glycosyltransferase involved in cell wall biosynthesis